MILVWAHSLILFLHTVAHPLALFWGSAFELRLHMEVEFQYQTCATEIVVVVVKPNDIFFQIEALYPSLGRAPGLDFVQLGLQLWTWLLVGGHQ